MEGVKAMVTEKGRQERPEDVLFGVGHEYNTKPHTPEFIRETWQTMLGAWVAIAKKNDPTLDISVPIVPDCGRTQRELEKLREDGKGRIYVPPFSYELLAKVFPLMRSRDVKHGVFQDKYDGYGWRDFYMSIAVPNLGITEDEAIRMTQDPDSREYGSGLGRLRTYIWASQASHAFIDPDRRYLDQEDETLSKVMEIPLGDGRIITVPDNQTYSLLPGTTLRGGTAYAFFLRNGFLGAYGWGKNTPSHNNGVRFERE